MVMSVDCSAGASAGVVGIVGYSGAGKTTLIERMLPLLREHLRVSVIKQARADFDIDRPGKDSWRHRQAGAGEVLVASERRWALMHECEGPAALTLDDYLARLSPCDLIVVEGFRQAPIPRIEVFRPSLGHSPMFASEPGIIAVASDAAFAAPIPVLPLDDPRAIAHFVLARVLGVVDKTSTVRGRA